jgi:hypothetical protein
MFETFLALAGVAVLVAAGVWATIINLLDRDRARHEEATPLLGVVSPKKKKEDEDA